MPSLPAPQSPIVPTDAPGQGDRAATMTPAQAARMLAAVEASKAALCFLEDLQMWIEADPALAGQEAADVALRLRAALTEIRALPGK